MRIVDVPRGNSAEEVMLEKSGDWGESGGSGKSGDVAVG